MRLHLLIALGLGLLSLGAQAVPRPQADDDILPHSQWNF
jgi:hypothetical protein